ncbi:MAG: SDR family oxidoreductase [Acidobacteria bacterium]|nr:SDR family oxidoreductase [Acidobacteriota bacterium]
MSNLSGRVAIVTGGASGIGAATAVELAASGCTVAICDVCAPEAAEPTLQRIVEAGGVPVFHQASVADRPAVEAMMDDVVERFGSIDILVNNAGINIRKPFVELEIDDVAKVWDVVLWGAFHCTQAAVRRMLKQGRGGAVVMISSVHGSRPYPNATAYNGGKAGVNHMAASWALELAGSGIRVNVIEPGWINTEGERRHFGEQVIAEQGKLLPMQRLGDPKEIAKAVRFLVSDDGSYITGALLRVDGAFSLAH